MDVRPIAACCAPLTDRALDDAQAAELAAAFKLLADPVRLRLLSLVATAPTGEICACDLPAVLGRSQPTVSHHLSALTEAGLLQREKRGKWAWFRVAPERLAVLRDALGVPSPAAPDQPLARGNSGVVRADDEDLGPVAHVGTSG